MTIDQTRSTLHQSIASDQTAAHVFHAEDSNEDLENQTSQSSENDSILLQPMASPSHRRSKE
jgi:hypothetical protein